jgi:hypothetical protein
VGGCRLDASGSGDGPVAGCSEHSKYTLGFRKRRGISRLAE